MRFNIGFRNRCILVLCWLGTGIATANTSYGSSKQDEPDLIARSKGVMTTNNYPVIQEWKIGSLTTEYLDSPLGVDKATPRVSWKIQNAKEEEEEEEAYSGIGSVSLSHQTRRNVFQQSYQLHVSSSTTSAVWTDCGWVTSNETSLVPLNCTGLTPISESDLDVSWRVTVVLNDGSMIDSDVTHFRTGILDSWKAQWINGGHRNPHENDRTLFRKEFFLKKANRTALVDGAVTTSAASSDGHYATLFVAGIGYNHVYLNGVKVGDHQLDPGWTNYEKRVLYSTYDVTHMLRFDDDGGKVIFNNEDDDGAGSVAPNNVISVMLGNGWWSCGPLPGTKQDHCTKDPPQLILQLHVDGHPVLISDETWRASSKNPVFYNSLYNGEVYDARLEESIQGWKSLGYNDSDWVVATSVENEATKAILASQLFEPIRHISRRSPVSIVVAGDDENLIQVLDFGQNQAAVVRLKQFYCARGTSVRLRHAEAIMHPPYGDYDNTTLYVDNLRKAKATDYYICRGDPEGESYTPTFTQHGFRYVEVTGLNYTLKPSDVEAVEIRSDVQQTSFIKFAYPLLNKIHHAVMWGLRSNFMSVQTDCNQRDERKGWMGDAALTAETSVLSYGMGAFYTHWLAQMSENQNAEGSMPNIVPPLEGTRIDSAPNWETAYPMILWSMMTYYGDSEVIYNHHDSLVRYFDCLDSIYRKNGLKNFRTGYGDWVPPRGQPNADLHFMGSFALLGDIKLGIDIFRYSTHPDSESQLKRLIELQTKIVPEFHDAFFNSTSGVYMSGLQTEQALALYLGVVPHELQASILSNLINDIQIKHKVHTTSGIVGIKYAMEVLSSLDRGDVALDLALQTSHPSWGYMMNSEFEPATTIWELWESDTRPPAMNSRNHHMFGSIGGWFYKHVAGIKALDPGFSRIQIRPNLLRHQNFTARISTPRGYVSLNYRKQEVMEQGNEDRATATEFLYEMVLPPCTSGTFHIPIALDDREMKFDENSINLSIEESGVPVWLDWQYLPDVDGVKCIEKVGRYIHVEITNGRYSFKVTGSKIFSVVAEV